MREVLCLNANDLNNRVFINVYNIIRFERKLSFSSLRSSKPDLESIIRTTDN